MDDPGPRAPLRPVLAADVRDALAAGLPVVALESTLITHGLPWPRNLEVARAAEAAVRAHGAVPATVAVRDGALLAGLDDSSVAELARARDVAKASRQNLAAVLGSGGWAGTTVSATMMVAHLCGIRVFATGGIGGVHRGALGAPGPTAPAVAVGASGAADTHAAPPTVGQDLDLGGTLDISADLDELARTPVVVVCSGPKAILDVGLTLEYLETRGVPVVALGTDEVAGFWSRDSGHLAPARCDSPAEVAALACRHWALPGAAGLLVAVPVPAESALPRADAEHAIVRALGEAAEAGIRGPATTPWLLARVADLTDGRSVTANVALIEHNAGVAAEIAVALSAG